MSDLTGTLEVTGNTEKLVRIQLKYQRYELQEELGPSKDIVHFVPKVFGDCEKGWKIIQQYRVISCKNATIAR